MFFSFRFFSTGGEDEDPRKVTRPARLLELKRDYMVYPVGQKYVIRWGNMLETRTRKET